ncbi:hypothetical protein [Collimonas sp.]|jgi:hypothetical protein|uniref:hypothetical protein n=1 Tax=Collimonas sp. TaxID=1963772 RepID=UPI002CDA0298|nr:hypothetical protein [Collimonas sp.]HWW03899.1 hypothetical protein [Collimonas sp.]
MKRFLIVVAAVVFGFLVAWGCGYAGSHIDWAMSQTPKHGCYEIDHCNVPWWIIALFIGSLFGPSIFYGVVAFIGTKLNWSPTRWIGTFIPLLVITCGLYFAGYALAA